MGCMFSERSVFTEEAVAMLKALLVATLEVSKSYQGCRPRWFARHRERNMQGKTSGFLSLTCEAFTFIQDTICFSTAQRCKHEHQHVLPRDTTGVPFAPSKILMMRNGKFCAFSQSEGGPGAAGRHLGALPQRCALPAGPPMTYPCSGRVFCLQGHITCHAD